MLYEEERNLLYLLGREFEGVGQIVDAGCFLGGSTFALARGVAANSRWRGTQRQVIHSYDYFVLDEWTKVAHADLVADVEAGASLRPKFDRLLGSYRGCVAVHEGDVRDFRWDGSLIEVLFIDICKSWDINDHVMRQFFPSLVPHRSIVIQQDFVHEWSPHVPVTMGFLSDWFEFAGFAAPSSAIFVPTRSIDPDDMPSSLWAAISDEAKLECFDRACAPFAGEEKAVLDCSKAILLAELGRHSDALECLDAVPMHSERAVTSVSATRSWILRSHPNRAVSMTAWARWNAERGA